LGDKVVQKNILLTGPPGCGKSTIIEKIVQRINLPCTGFFTREMRERGRRVGFSMVPENENVVVVVDEIGKMECFSAMFRQGLLRVLNSPNTVVASIALKGDAFINAIKKRPDSRLIRVFEKNRDVLAEEVLRWRSGADLGRLRTGT